MLNVVEFIPHPRVHARDDTCQGRNARGFYKVRDDGGGGVGESIAAGFPPVEVVIVERGQEVVFDRGRGGRSVSSPY